MEGPVSVPVSVPEASRQVADDLPPESFVFDEDFSKPNFLFECCANCFVVMYQCYHYSTLSVPVLPLFYPPCTSVDIILPYLYQCYHYSTLSVPVLPLFYPIRTSVTIILPSLYQC